MVVEVVTLLLDLIFFDNCFLDSLLVSIGPVWDVMARNLAEVEVAESGGKAESVGMNRSVLSDSKSNFFSESKHFSESNIFQSQIFSESKFVQKLTIKKLTRFKSDGGFFSENIATSITSNDRIIQTFCRSNYVTVHLVVSWFLPLPSWPRRSFDQMMILEWEKSLCLMTVLVHMFS